MGKRQWVEWPARYWIGLALLVWIVRAVVLGVLGNADAGPLLAAVAVVLLLVGVARAVMDWLTSNFGRVDRADDH